MADAEERKPLPTKGDGYGDAHADADPESVEQMESAAKWRYGAIMLFAFLAAIVLRWISDNSSFLNVIPSLKSECHDNKGCLGNAIVYRISFSLFTFFFVHLLAASPVSCCFGDDQKHSIFLGGWWIKTWVFVALCFVSLFLPADLFTGFAYFSIGLACLFLIMQAVIIIAFAYDLNDGWAGQGGMNDDWTGETDTRFKRAIVSCTLLFFAFGVTMTGLEYYWFTPSTCSSTDKALHQFFITFTLIGSILFSVASMHPAVEHGSIFCSGIIFAYCSWIVFGAVMSGSEDSSCNRMHQDAGKMSVNNMFQILVAALTLVYTSLNTGQSSGVFSMTGSDNGGEKQPKFSFTFFFIAMCVGAGYLAMVLTSWQVDKGMDAGNVNPLRVDHSQTSMWAKLASEWFTILLYCQTLWAPFCCGQGKMCCGDRDFTL